MANGTTAAAVAKVELYNVFEGGRTVVANGYKVGRYLADGRRCETLKTFVRDEAGARAFAATWNGRDGKGSTVRVDGMKVWDGGRASVEWKVARYTLDGEFAEVLRAFGSDLAAARRFVAQWSGERVTEPEEVASLGKTSMGGDAFLMKRSDGKVVQVVIPGAEVSK